ncbi:MAG: undecaprenyldiphospho-muramoylpentapeptide beta-N-acetylglucosaminyltransferase [Patescibacteria group bacterium]
MKIKVILTGGGTGGSVTPLIAVAQNLESRYQNEIEFLWLGTNNGPEKKLASRYNIKFIVIPAGKWRRYFSWQNCLDIFKVIAGFICSFFIIIFYQPKVIASAGSFVSVPVAWAAWLLRKPFLIHQQDVVPGLANKLMTPFAEIVTVALDKSLNDFPPQKVKYVGNPYRQEILNGSREKAFNFFKLEKNLPVILVIGGGTGSEFMNHLIIEALPELTTFAQVIHLSGESKSLGAKSNHYKQYSFLQEELKDAYAAADLVITRAGMGVLTELSILGKPSIIIPIPDSHQEANADYFAERGAAVVLPQNNLTPQILIEKIKDLIAHKEKLSLYQEKIKTIMPTDATQKLADIIYDYRNK